MPSQTGEENQAILTTQIIDTGIGISEERQSFLFRPFGEL